MVRGGCVEEPVEGAVGVCPCAVAPDGAEVELEGAAAVPCSPALAEVLGACDSPAVGFTGARFGFPAFFVGAVWARAPPAARLIAAARQSGRSIRFTLPESARDARE